MAATLRTRHVLLATALLLPGVEAKKRTAGSKQVNSRKRECEQTTCSSTHIDERENQAVHGFGGGQQVTTMLSVPIVKAPLMPPTHSKATLSATLGVPFVYW